MTVEIDISKLNDLRAEVERRGLYQLRGAITDKTPSLFEEQ